MNRTVIVYLALPSPEVIILLASNNSPASNGRIIFYSYDTCNDLLGVLLIATSSVSNALLPVIVRVKHLEHLHNYIHF